MVAVAVRSLGDLDTDVTLPQYRALVVLASRGPQRLLELSGELGVNPSTGMRMCERLEAKGLIARERDAADRRQVLVSLTAPGRGVVEEVTARRRVELQHVVDTLPDAALRPTTRALRDVVAAVGEPQEAEWWLGWHPSTSDR